MVEHMLASMQEALSSIPVIHTQKKPKQPCGDGYMECHVCTDQYMLD
jgi:hypothetical protein